MLNPASVEGAQRILTKENEIPRHIKQVTNSKGLKLKKSMFFAQDGIKVGISKATLV